MDEADRHPRWCLTEHCQPDLHAGRPHQIPPAYPGQPPVTAQLVQANVPGAETHVVITGGEGLTLTLVQSRVLGGTLARLTRIGGAR